MAEAGDYWTLTAFWTEEGPQNSRCLHPLWKVCKYAGNMMVENSTPAMEKTPKSFSYSFPSSPFSFLSSSLPSSFSFFPPLLLFLLPSPPFSLPPLHRWVASLSLRLPSAVWQLLPSLWVGPNHCTTTHGHPWGTAQDIHGQGRTVSVCVSITSGYSTI